LLGSLAACSGGGGSPESSNSAPTASAGTDQAVDELTNVSLSAAGSQDPDGTITGYLWSQLSGTTVAIQNSGAETASFIAPAISVTEILSFQVRVTDNGNVSAVDTVQVTVNPIAGLNAPPVADAGVDQTVAELTQATLSGAASDDPDGTIEMFDWQQSSGPAVVISGADTSSITFTTPDVVGTADLIFELTVTDNEGAAETAMVTVTVVENLLVTVSGAVSFDFVPVVSSGMGAFLDYGSTQARAARGVVVQLIEESGTIVDTTVTDASGDFSLTAQAATNIFVRARAEMQQAGSPGWDVRVVDNTNALALYVMDSALFNSGGVDLTRDLHADSGWTGTSYSNPRVAAPFAILDTVYEAMQFLMTADASVVFPALTMHWSPNNVATYGVNGVPDTTTGELGTSFFRSGPGGGIFILGDENNDTDEYDRHVIAHEWFHYFDLNFSRSDSLGGPHSQDDQLDMTVAFGEGIANAFSAMITSNPVYTDTGGPQQSFGFDINIENSATTTPGWFNEFSVHEVVYDLFDPVGESGADAIELGVGPLYDVLIDEQRMTLAVTSIFPFIDALKTDLPASAAAIDSLLLGQSIASVTDEFGSTETNSGYPANADVLPIYSVLTVNGGSVNVCSTDDFRSAFTGSVNKLGSRRYLRFNAATNASYTFTAVTTSAQPGESTDPDMWLHRGGRLFPPFGAAPTAECTSAALENCLEAGSRGLTAGDYVLEVFEWTNTNASDDPEFPPIGKTCFDVEVTSP
jgi:hypothetical protein